LMSVFSEHGSMKYRLIFADPPFGIGVAYEGDYSDDMSESEYRQFTEQWLVRAADLLLGGGRLYVHVPDNCVHSVLDAARVAGLERVEWVIWHFRFGQCTKSKYINSKCHGLVFTNDRNNMTWNFRNILVDSDRSSTYNDRRTLDSATPGRRVPFDVWGVPSDGPYWGRVQGNSVERRPLHKNQLPEKYLERILLGYTSPEDWVLDPFGGSGTSAVVARSLRRNFVTVEQSSEYAHSITNRVLLGRPR